MIIQRGFEKESITQIFTLLIEECGELAKAIRKSQNIHTDENSKHHELDHELADIFMYLLDICNYYKVDLEKAFRDKEEINKKRVWKLL
jgi:NTP pyrophosphatase (non-canonical NTP hydrolase)